MAGDVMRWASVFLSYFIPTALLFVLHMLDWVQRETRWRPSLVRSKSRDIFTASVGGERNKETTDANWISSRNSEGGEWHAVEGACQHCTVLAVQRRGVMTSRRRRVVLGLDLGDRDPYRGQYELHTLSWRHGEGTLVRVTRE